MGTKYDPVIAEALCTVNRPVVAGREDKIRVVGKESETQRSNHSEGKGKEKGGGGGICTLPFCLIRLHSQSQGGIEKHKGGYIKHQRSLTSSVVQQGSMWYTAAGVNQKKKAITLTNWADVQRENEYC